MSGEQPGRDQVPEHHRLRLRQLLNSPALAAQVVALVDRMWQEAWYAGATWGIGNARPRYLLVTPQQLEQIEADNPVLTAQAPPVEQAGAQELLQAAPSRTPGLG